MDYRVDEYLESLYNQCTQKYEYRGNDIKEWKILKEKLKDDFIKDLGGFPKYRGPSNFEIIQEREYEDYTMNRITYFSDKGFKVPAYVLKPKNTSKKLPAVIACHGHGYGSRDIVGLDPNGLEKKYESGYQKNFAVELVKKGFIVIAPELLGFGDRRLKEDKNKELEESSCHRISTYLLMLGKTIAGIRVYEIIRTIDYLLTRDDVDKNKIGCMGISGGGLVCAFASALDDRIKASVISGYTNTFKDSVMAMFHCVDNYIPSVLKHSEMPGIISMIAPRPLLIEAGIKDPIFPIEATKKAYSQIEKVYEIFDAKECLDIDIFNKDHQISGKKSYDWLARWLY